MQLILLLMLRKNYSGLILTAIMYRVEMYRNLIALLLQMQKIFLLSQQQILKLFLLILIPVNFQPLILTIFLFKLYLLIMIKMVPVLNQLIIILLSMQKKLMMAQSDFFNIELSMKPLKKLENMTTEDGLGQRNQKQFLLLLLLPPSIQMEN